ncbi:aromatic ring-hydroxylating oxygenase subunit alpha [Sphingomonas bacterium]|uniref:aromatic ring-hydroxylating oxygenase subunit alpha n=1 Tax=Sphingomonas bacterium TaxID=1895847 RepID=UPI0015769F21|nr:aromatic ring-hydroxylating dioxygenase subunit alpha [Sphingomonas bacterium]
MAVSPFSPDDVRDDFVPKGDYYDPAFAAAEAENLWPKVWQIACRLEEIPKPGDYYTYEILTDSIIVVRTGAGDDDVKALHNACPHRGTLLTTGCGHAKQFVCPFHGWRFGLDGRNAKVVDRHDWGSCLKDEDIDLAPVQAGTWGGWVWINMDPECQPLDAFLEPMKSRCDKMEFEKLRFAWYKSTIVEANWKTVVEAFTEFYHVQTTHQQMLTYTKDYSTSRAMGRHGWMSYEFGTGLPIGRSARLEPLEQEPDFREYLYEYGKQFKNDLAAMQTERAFQSIQALRELPADASPVEVLTKWGEGIYQRAMESGAGWPEGLTPEYMAETGFDWHVFPNTVFLHPAIEAVLWYRMRPHGSDPEKCYFDTWSLERYPPGEEPEVKQEFNADWRDGNYPLIYTQDFENMPKVQKGLRSRGFKGARTSPVQERAIANFHRRLRSFLQDPHKDDDLGPEPKRDQP